MVYNLAQETTGIFIPGMKRIWWGAQPPVYKDPIPLPLSYVRLTHTGTQACTTKAECCGFLQTIQKFYIHEAKLTDIPYSFMVGGDGFVYKGRGWFSEPARPPNLKCLASKCLDIAFIGNYEGKEPDYKLMKLATDLITYGVKVGKLLPDYKLIKLGESPPIEC